MTTPDIASTPPSLDKLSPALQAANRRLSEYAMRLLVWNGALDNDTADRLELHAPHANPDRAKAGWRI